jgi:hypothetical protein
MPYRGGPSYAIIRKAFYDVKPGRGADAQRAHPP